MYEGSKSDHSNMIDWMNSSFHLGPDFFFLFLLADYLFIIQPAAERQGPIKEKSLSQIDILVF